MKIIETRLSEDSFLTRLKKLTTEQKTFGKGYENKSCFVLKWKNNTFRIGKHVRKVWKTDGYMNVFLYGKYCIDSNGNVSVQYSFRKPLLYLFPFLLIVLLITPTFLYLVYDAIMNGQVQLPALVVTGLFSILGFGGILGSSRQNRKQLKAHLYKICKIKE